MKFQNLGSATLADTTDRLKVEVWVHGFAPGSLIFDGRFLIYENIIAVL